MLLASEPRHVFDRFEFLSLDNGKVAEYALGLAAKQCFKLAPDTLCGTGRVVHYPCNFVEEPVRRLDHCRLRSPVSLSLARRPYTMAIVRRYRKMRSSRPDGTTQCNMPPRRRSYRCWSCRS